MRLPARKRFRLIPVVAAAMAACAGIGVSGCAKARRIFHQPSPGPGAQARPTEPRLDAILGKTLVIPVTLEGAVNPARPIHVRLDDGRVLPAKLYWISVRPVPGEDPWGWVVPPGLWTATPAQAATRPSAAGSWSLVIDLPYTAVGQGLWIGSDRYPLNWLPDPSLVRSGEGGEPWTAPLGADVPPSLLAMAVSEAQSPVRRWRYLLLSRGLKPPPPDSDESAGLPALSDPVLEALARQTEARWRIAIALLWGADAEVAGRVKRRLAAGLDFGNGNVAPAWASGEVELGALQSDLLSPRLDASQRSERAKAWLDSLPPAAGWVIDDAGLRDAVSGRAISTCGIANLTERTTLGWGVPVGEAAAPDLTTLEPSAAREIAVIVPPPERGAVRLTTPITLHAGRWSSVRPVAADRLPAAPPGLKIGTLVGDWRMDALVAGAPDAEMTGDPAWATAGLVYRAADEGDQWSLYLECRQPPGQSKPETVRVWLGAFGSTRSILKVSSEGAASDELAPGRSLDSAAAPVIVHHDDKWILRIPIPATRIEPDHTIRIAVERTDARGRRSAWPRPMLPWQAEPGRAWVDLGAWPAGSPAATPASTTR